MQINILHLSDLHLSKKHVPDLKVKLESLVKDIKKVQSKHGVQPDMIVLTGDLISRGDKAAEEFPLVVSEFIEPLLVATGLSMNTVFICPGNHEVDRTKIISMYEAGLDAQLSSSEKFVDYHESWSEKRGEIELLFGKLGAYKNFVKGLNNKNLTHSSDLYDVYICNIKSLKIGIISLNSAWKCSASGSEHDRGRLIIGKSVFDEAARRIQDCDLKLALAHHPLDMLTDWDQQEVKRSMASSINLLCTGHIHDSNFVFFREILGSLHVSTAASIYQGRVALGYTILSCDFGKKTISAYLRKWYPSRSEFDHEIEKCENGIVTFQEFKTNSVEKNAIIAISKIKEEMQATSASKSIILPVELAHAVKLEDVFVEPIISTLSSYDKDRRAKGETITLRQLIDIKSNLVIYGRKEYGKSMLLEWIKEHYLSLNIDTESKIPILLDFEDLPKNNWKGIKSLIGARLGGGGQFDNIDLYLLAGNFIFIVDDFNDLKDRHRDSRRKELEKFYEAYPKNQYILSSNERIGQIYKDEAAQFHNKIQAQDLYLAPLNTAKIREILSKWHGRVKFDLNEVLDQIVYYFRQLKIPVTPMAVTLFLGVLFKDPASKNIRNEAYLIENFLESIMEKINPEEKEPGLDFRDKESFLIYLAKKMSERERPELSTSEYESYKSRYYEDFGEDVPTESFFKTFFSKAILQEVSGKVSFTFKFWFNYFMAKAMQTDAVFKQSLLNTQNYLDYSIAFGYKAGLDRNDVSLLETIDARVVAALGNKINHTKVCLFDKSDSDKDNPLLMFGRGIEKEIKEKNKSSAKDEVRDEAYLNQEQEDRRAGDLVELITLHADIVRNTREISADLKMRYLSSNVDYFICLLWSTLEEFKSMIKSSKGIEDLQALLRLNLKTDDDQKKLIEHINRIIYRILPLSFSVYMSDHLSNPRLKNTLLALIKSDKLLTHKLFYTLLLLEIDFSEAKDEIKKFIDASKSIIADDIILMYLRYYCYRKVLSKDGFNTVLQLIQKIRRKHATRTKSLPYMRDSVEADILKELQKAQTKLISG